MILSRITLKIVQQSWPVWLGLPLIFYGNVLFNFLVNAHSVWIMRAWLPGLMVVIAFILYRQQRPGALIAFSLSAVIALGIGGLIAWTASQQLLIPYLPQHQKRPRQQLDPQEAYLH